MSQDSSTATWNEYKRLLREQEKADLMQSPADEFIRSLPWSADATEEEKALVAGNIRCFWAWLCVSGQGKSLTSAVRESTFESPADVDARTALAETAEAVSPSSSTRAPLTLFSEALDVLRELVGLIKAHREGEYEFDSFTTQPAEALLRRFAPVTEAEVMPVSLGKCANEGKCECDYPQCQYPGSPCCIASAIAASKDVLPEERMYPTDRRGADK